MTEKSKEKILEYIKNNHLDYDGVFGELVDASESSVDLLWRLALDFYSPLQTHTSIVTSKEEMIIHELFKQCKSFKKQRDELINDMADIKRKAEAWDKQKKQLREMVIFGCHLEENTPSKYMNEAYKIVFKKMCELDCTNDFQNLLSDLEEQ